MEAYADSIASKEVLKRFSDFFGVSFVQQALVEARAVPGSRLDLLYAINQALARREEARGDTDTTAFLKQRFCSAPADLEIVFD